MASTAEITITNFQTPIGEMFAAATDDGVCLLEFTDDRDLETKYKEFAQKHNKVAAFGEHEHLSNLKKELEEYFDGKRKSFVTPLKLIGTPFQQSVWRELLNVPYGRTRSYKAQAVALNKLEAIRAVAGANGANPISIIVPCHRIIGENGSLTGYGGGLWRKKWLLELESGQQLMNL